MSSLRPYAFNPERIVSEARMIFSGEGKYTIVVEGESDFRLFGQWLIEEDARIRKSGGKGHAVQIWNRAEGRFAGLICVVDMDYEPIIGSSLIDDERFIYVSGSVGPDAGAVDGIDLEATLIRSSALAKFLINKFRGSELYSDSLNENIRQLRERLRVSARDLGAVRAADASSYRRCKRSPVGGGLEISETFFDANEIKLSFEGLSKVLLRSSATGSKEMELLLDEASELREKYAEGWELCRGHDLSEMLAQHLSCRLERKVSQRDVEEGLRMSCELEVLENTHFGLRLSRLRDIIGKELFGHPQH